MYLNDDGGGRSSNIVGQADCNGDFAVLQLEEKLDNRHCYELEASDDEDDYDD